MFYKVIGLFFMHRLHPVLVFSLMCCGCATRFIPENIYSRGLTPGMNIELKPEKILPTTDDNIYVNL